MSMPRLYEEGALESLRRTIEVLDHAIGSLYDRLDRYPEPEEARRGVERRISDHDGTLAETKRQYVIQLNTMRVTSPEVVERWVLGRIERLEALRGRLGDLAASELERDTLEHVVGSLQERWRAVLDGSDEPVVEHPSLIERV